MIKTMIIKNNFKNTCDILSENFKKIRTDGSVFCLIKNEYQNNELKKDFMDVINFGISLGLDYINTIIVPNSSQTIDNIFYCVWFSKNRKIMFFDKDVIREKSIWKNVEWGKREKNYNPKGKDPGNVWIPTIDDGKANITQHVFFTIKDIYDRILISTLIDDNEYKIYTDDSSENRYSFNGFKGETVCLKDEYEEINDFNYVGGEAPKNIKIFGKIFFDTSENMKRISDNSVELVVTSPPYWDLKDYYKENQIGQESYEKYSDRMFQVWSECYKKLTNTGSLWININIRTRDGQPIILPKLFVEQCKKIGYKYKTILIWHKSSGIPTNSKNLVDHHEYVLVFTKSETNKIKSFSANSFADYKNDRINGKLIWNINRKAGSIGKNTIHPAIFPTELINRIVKLSTSPGDIVLDPFLGSGTSLIASVNNNRSFVGYEYNEQFKELMNNRFLNEIDDCNTINIKFI